MRRGADTMQELGAALVLSAAAALLCARARQQRRRKLVVFVISLRRRPAKRAAALTRAATAGLSDIRVLHAIDGKELGWEALHARGVRLYPGWRLPGSTYRFYNRDLKWGEIGCALSHHAVWTAIVHLGLPWAVILEDDACFMPRVDELILGAVARLEALAAAGDVPAPDLLYLARNACWPRRESKLSSFASGAAAGAAPSGAPNELVTGSNALRDDAASFPPVSPGVEIVVPAFSYKCTAYVLWASGARKLLASGYLSRLIPVDDLLPLLYTAHDPGPGLARPDLDALFSDALRLTAFAMRPAVAWERRGLSDTENSEVVSGGDEEDENACDGAAAALQAVS
jgi:collagen beta-1,O-galactosyltransferase